VTHEGQAREGRGTGLNGGRCGGRATGLDLRGPGGARPPRHANAAAAAAAAKNMMSGGKKGGCWWSVMCELELIQSHMPQKPVLRGEVGRACVAREVSVERGGMCLRRVPGHSLRRIPCACSRYSRNPVSRLNSSCMRVALVLTTAVSAPALPTAFRVMVENGVGSGCVGADRRSSRPYKPKVLW